MDEQGCGCVGRVESECARRTRARVRGADTVTVELRESIRKNSVKHNVAIAVAISVIVIVIVVDDRPAYVLCSLSSVGCKVADSSQLSQRASVGCTSER